MAGCWVNNEGVAGDVDHASGASLLAAGAPSRSASAWDLDDLLTMVKQEGRQAGAEAAGSLDRPAATRPGKWLVANPSSC